MKGLLAIALILLLAGAGGLWWQTRPPSEEAAPVRITVEPGTSVRAIGRRLEDEGVVRSALLFEAWVRARGDAGRIQAGTYELPRDRSLPAVVEALVEGRTILVAVTVPEGYRLEQTAAAVARALPVDSAAFIAAVTDPALVDSLLPDSLVGAGAVTLEGYLFPETYRVDPSIGTRDLTRLMVAHFWREFGPSWRARADSLGRSVHEIVTLASIVEEEARVPDERTVIAGVFWNRLDIGMPLEADPTVQYSLGGHRERVLYRDLEVDSPYNTYRVAGLPPGPISSPGRSALEATMWPDSVPYLFFFATGEGGRHTFSETFAEHNRKRREMNR
ncbi:MAG TPA: endolytic transglycosylase MltG [Gemmatimonadota bacterium]|nr:endolytic transglycosylase MltG [Gemmatimonadota bacterium]